MKVWILLPAFNEEDSIPAMLPKIAEVLKAQALDYRVVIVNDGSSDTTADVAARYGREYPVDVVTHVINRGLGETERDGFEFIAANCAPDDIIVRMDCDDTHEPEYVPALLAKMAEGFDVVNTSRFQPGGGQMGLNGYRTFISRAANLFMQTVFRIPGVRDCSCGYRAYRAGVIQDAIRIFGNNFIQLRGLGFTSTLEMLVKLHILGCRFAEVPFVLRYDQKRSPSKMVSSITTLGYLMMTLLYYWPFGGWRRSYRGLRALYRESPDRAIQRFAGGRLRLRAASRIGI
jgi:dolichol-phosphate mannosyltransferase